MSSSSPTTANQAFGGRDAELAASLASPVSPTTDKSAAEAMQAGRRTSEWTAPAGTQFSRTKSFSMEDQKRAMSMKNIDGIGPQPGFSEKA